MNPSSNRRLTAWAALALLAFGAQATLCSADDVDDLLLHQAGEFELANGQNKIIADHTNPEPYRVCVAKGPDSVPVAARYDGQERTIPVGDCAEVTGKHITLAPAARLKQDEVLVGKYEHRR